MVTKLAENPSVRLLKHVVRCYLRFSEQQKSRNALKKCLPNALKDQTFAAVLRTEDSVQKWLQQLLKNISLLPSDTTNFSLPTNQASTIPSQGNSNASGQHSFQNLSVPAGSGPAQGNPSTAYPQSRLLGINSVGAAASPAQIPVQIGQSFGIPSAPGSWHQSSNS